MEDLTNLAKLSQSISNRLLESINLIKVMEEIIDGDAREGTLLKIIYDNNKAAFDEIEQARKVVGIID